MHGPHNLDLRHSLVEQKNVKKNLDIRPEDVLSPNDPSAVDKIVAEIDRERDLLLEYREKMKRWKIFHRAVDPEYLHHHYI